MPGLPAFAKGKMRECTVCGFWFPERDSRMLIYGNKWICKWDLDEEGMGTPRGPGAIKKTLETGDGIPIETGDGETIRVT